MIKIGPPPYNTVEINPEWLKIYLESVDDIAKRVGGQTVLKQEQKPETKSIRTCNRHVDCDAADAVVKAKGGFIASHCYDECCEDCFGS